MPPRDLKLPKINGERKGFARDSERRAGFRPSTIDPQLSPLADSLTQRPERCCDLSLDFSYEDHTVKSCLLQPHPPKLAARVISEAMARASSSPRSRLAGHSLRQKCLASSRGAHQQRTLGNLRAQLGVSESVNPPMTATPKTNSRVISSLSESDRECSQNPWQRVKRASCRIRLLWVGVEVA